MEKIEKDGKYFIEVIYKSPFEDEEDMKWLFRELNCAEFMALDVSEKLIEGKTKLGQATAPMIYMINTMMVEGEKVKDSTNYRILSHLTKELKDFLM